MPRGTLKGTDDDAENSVSAEPENNSDADDDATGNEAWADVLGKLLRTKPPRTKTPILFKAKKDAQIRVKVAPTPVEVVDDEGEVKPLETQKEKRPEEALYISKRALRERNEKKRKWEEMSRSKPESGEKERHLARLATKGVVQLFNAVKKHQKEVEEKLRAAGESETRRDKVMKTLSKGAFLDMLKDKQEKPQDKPETWTILRDDFMLGADMKDWDKQDEDDETVNKD
ncbi:RRP15-like protein [Ixodes scapularis]